MITTTIARFTSRVALTAIVLVLVLTGPMMAQSRPVVVIDAGHGGSEAGVVVGDWLEKDLVLEVAMAIGADFAKAGFDVVFTRTRDVAVGWNERRAIAEAAGATALVMLHAMGGDNPEAHGTEIYFSPQQSHSARLAERTGAALGAAGMTVKVEGRGQSFLASPTVRTVMIELAHMSNPLERRLLRSSAFHHELGGILAAAVKADAASTKP